ncbi:MAG: hypothetical protein ABSB23_12660 [Bryobacteraceae bacterium]|jgi:uncharacterized protein (TIGR03437 family)
MKRLACLCVLMAPLQAQSGNAPPAALQQIEQWVDTCPASDPAIQQIRADFDIRLDSVPVTQFPCVEPYTQTPLEQFSLQTVVLQVLRLMYYLDTGRSEYLPWTSLRLYDWMKSKLRGIDIRSDYGANQCCETINGRQYMMFNGTARDDVNKAYLLSLDGLLSNLTVVAHEARHVDGFPHVSCCGIPQGCDQTYDEKNLSPYGIQFYLQRAWLTGKDLNLNLACLDPAGLGSNVFRLNDANNYILNFCDTKPEALPASTKIGGDCQPGPYPYIYPGGIGNVANYDMSAIAVGSAVAIYGPNLATDMGQAPGGPLPTALKGTSLTVAGKAAPLYFASPLQSNAQVPYETPPGLTPVTVTANGNVGFRHYITVNSTAPAMFVTSDNFVLAQNQDYSLNSTNNPAAPGTYVTIYFTGQGASDNPVATGAATPPAPYSRPAASASITIGGVTETIYFIGLTPGYVALSQVNVLIGPATPAGTQPVVLTVGGVASAPALIAIGH